jgi:DNA-binding MarR family transcriptional regulator
MAGRVTDEEYARLLRFRTGLRRFERWSEQRAAAEGLTGAQHQLLLAVRGHSDRLGPTVGDLSDYLLLRHHSVVELIDRASTAGLVERKSDKLDRRLVRVGLTARGSGVLRRLTQAHVDELARLGGEFEALWAGLEPTRQRPPARKPRAE